MNESTYLIQYRSSEHEPWKDDTMRYSTAALAATRRERCKESKVMRNALFRTIQRVDTEV